MLKRINLIELLVALLLNFLQFLYCVASLWQALHSCLPSLASSLSASWVTSELACACIGVLNIMTSSSLSNAITCMQPSLALVAKCAAIVQRGGAADPTRSHRAHLRDSQSVVRLFATLLNHAGEVATLMVAAGALPLLCSVFSDCDSCTTCCADVPEAHTHGSMRQVVLTCIVRCIAAWPTLLDDVCASPSVTPTPFPFSALVSLQVSPLPADGSTDDDTRPHPERLQCALERRLSVLALIYTLSRSEGGRRLIMSNLAASLAACAAVSEWAVTGQWKLCSGYVDTSAPLTAVPRRLSGALLSRKALSRSPGQFASSPALNKPELFGPSLDDVLAAHARGSLPPPKEFIGRALRAMLQYASSGAHLQPC